MFASAISKFVLATLASAIYVRSVTAFEGDGASHFVCLIDIIIDA